MAYTYDLATSLGQVRMLIPDRPADGATFGANDAKLFTDSEITAFLDMEASIVKCAAALALETIASDNAMISKVIRLLDRATDGANASRALRERAAVLRQQAEAEAQADEGPGFDWAEMVVNPFAARERIINEELRNG